MGNIFGRVIVQPCLNMAKSRRSQAAALGLLAVGLGFYLAHPHFFADQQSAVTDAKSADVDPGQSFNLDDCTLRYLSVGPKAAYIQIARDGKILLKQEAPSGQFRLLTTEGADNHHNIYTAPLVNLKERDVVAEVTGASGDHRYIVIALAKDESRTQAPQVVASINTDKNKLQYLDGGKGNIFGLSTTDTFEGWGAEPVAPTLNFHLADADAQNPSKAHLEPIRTFVDTKLLRDNIQDLKGQFDDLMVAEDAPITFAPASLADEMAGLIYAGHKKEALKLLDDVWPQQNLARKKRFYAAFIAEMEKSPNWVFVKKIN